MRNRQQGVAPAPPMQPHGFYPGPPMGNAPQPGFAPPTAGYPSYNGYPPPGVAPQPGYYPPPQESLYVYQGNGPPPQGTNNIQYTV